MSVQIVKEYLKQWSLDDGVREFSVSSATVELAAQALHVIPARIAKTLAFQNAQGCVLIVTAGDTKIDNPKFKQQFSMKATMLSPEDTLALTGFAVGGVCPFGVPGDVAVYTDISLRRFDTVFPACGSSSSAIELTCDALFACSKSRAWIDVCKGWQE